MVPCFFRYNQGVRYGSVKGWARFGSLTIIGWTKMAICWENRFFRGKFLPIKLIMYTFATVYENRILFNQHQ